MQSQTMQGTLLPVLLEYHNTSKVIINAISLSRQMRMDHSDGVLSVVRLTLWNAIASPVGIPQYVQGTLLPVLLEYHNTSKERYCQSCWNTTIRPSRSRNVPNSEIPDIFLKASVQKGMLPIILEDLIGVDFGQLCVWVYLSNSVTAYGCEMIEKTKEVSSFGRDWIHSFNPNIELVEAKYTIENRYKHDARVIYGNTDSVMAKFGLKEVGEVMQMRIEPILGETLSSLLTGSHVRTISVAAPASMGGLMKFAVRTATCLGCKTPLPKDETAVCINCRPKMVKLYQKHLNNMTEMEEKYLRLWTQCQRCQGSLYQDVIYSAQDCPIFYMRKTAQKDLNDASKTMNRFAYEW
ncbi:hypothetical protein BCR33DRAFT_773251 [Rhizoclosmatium globosum]|uniref:DNA-directed DNA polymerase n=1 Tax=Rhizoclosmatium globosum TaxID=329046 RepID=A0A1Y2AYK4_9FUNG|nr:hypothetical protein BCR33DRAFT_773251 [Rhizoclosmatium globosum]|eukprot:ORY27307.1 hypothetical protein BCR33DRAFT_773251 [Rhizoclosmatium globosum]